MLSHICNRYNLNSHKPDLCKKWKYFVTAQAILDSKCLFFFFWLSSKKCNESWSYSCLFQFKTQAVFPPSNSRTMISGIVQSLFSKFLSFLKSYSLPCPFSSSEACIHLRYQGKKGGKLNKEWVVGRTCISSTSSPSAISCH